MVLGSHNTMTYLKPRKWWMWFGIFVAKCQSLSYQEQYESGAKWFDLRISFPDKSNTPIFSHGLVDYKGVSLDEVIEYINTKPDLYFRLVLEKGNDKYKFLNCVNSYLSKYPDMKLVSAQIKGEWINLIEPKHKLPFGTKDCYASCNGYYPKYEKYKGIFKNKVVSGLLIDDLYPYIYAKLHNKKNIEKYKNQDIILLIDFLKHK